MGLKDFVENDCSPGALSTLPPPAMAVVADRVAVQSPRAIVVAVGTSHRQPRRATSHREPRRAAALAVSHRELCGLVMNHESV